MHLSQVPGQFLPRRSRFTRLIVAACLLPATLPAVFQAQTAATSTGTPQNAAQQTVGAAQAAKAQQGAGTSDAQKTPNSNQSTLGIGSKGTDSKEKNGTDPKSSAKPASAGEDSASETKLRLGPLDPSVAPTNLPRGRPTIGLAMGGGAALAMTEIGVIQWFEEHHIPVDVIAGTSMGSILSALYSTGKTPAEMSKILTNESVNSVFRISSQYSSLSFRRREDTRDLPGGIGVGLKHGASLRNSLLTDTGLNELLDKEFLNYNDQTDFNNLPIPFRCQATDLNAAKTVTFSRGSLQDAVRASASIPGVFRPFEYQGHEFVDGAILDNLPTADVKAMHADVILAISLPLDPVGKGDLDSILGVLQRAFAVGIEANEARDRKLADLVITPDTTGFGANDYLKTADLARRGYEAAEKNKAALLKYAVTDDQWDAYVAHKRSLQRPRATTIYQVKVKAPSPGVTDAVNRRFQPLVGQPVNTKQIESLLSDIRADGRYDADYTVGYKDATSTEPIILISVDSKKTGPPFLEAGVNIQAQTAGVTRAGLDTILVYQDLGGYGSEARARVSLGFNTVVAGDYLYRPVKASGYFIDPTANFNREPFYIYAGNTRLSERQSQFAGGGLDVGWNDRKLQEFRVGYLYQTVQWSTTTGSDGMPDYGGNSQRVRARYVFDNQDRGLIPRYGIRSVTDVGYLFSIANSPSAPQLFQQIEAAHGFGPTTDNVQKNVALINVEAGTMFNRDVPQPFRYTLGGPLRLAASAIDQYRGTDYFLVTPGYLRQLRTLPAPLNNTIYAGGSFEFGQMRSPDGRTITRGDIYIGLIAETPLGVISIGPSIGNAGDRKFNFTLGRLF